MTTTPPSMNDVYVFTKLVEELGKSAIENGVQDDDDWKKFEEQITAAEVTCAPDSYLDHGGLPLPVLKIVSKYALGEHNSGRRWFNGLDNEVHPLFSRHLWESDEKCEMTDEIFVLIKPALQLASLLLTDPAAREWLKNVATCPIKVSSEKDYSYFELPSEVSAAESGRNPGHFSDSVEAVGESVVDEIFAKMMKKLRFRFSELNVSSGQFSRYYDRITFNKHYITHLRKDTPPNLPIMLQMTNTICHEIGHAYFNYARLDENFKIRVRKSRGVDGRRKRQWEPNGPYGPMDEPRYGSDSRSRYPELGRSIQFAIFRHPWVHMCGIVTLSSATVQASKIPLTGSLMEYKHQAFKRTYEVQQMLIEECPEEHIDLSFVTGAWIQQWFLDETWKDKDDPLAGMNDDASLGRMRLKLNYPIDGWKTVLASVPGKKNTLVIIWPLKFSSKKVVHFYERPGMLP